ncbi:MAG: ankyrin repeat domain-containing protein [Deltaproteobacteria bacterium]|nr:ankyrin repeat domain-containing protein [Deltaproteobacteria bacterium]
MLGFLFGSKDKKLVRAASEGDLAKVKSLLAKGASANASEDGETALVAAVANSHDAIAAALLAGGADPNLGPEAGLTPLTAAIFGGSEKLVTTLLGAGANAKLADEEGHTPLHLAAYKGTPAMIKLLLSKGADVQSKTADGHSPLWESCYWGSFENAAVLLDARANVNSASAEGVTPLMNLVTQFRLWTMGALAPDGAVGLAGLGNLLQGLANAAEGPVKLPDGLLPLIDRMVAAGADVNARDANGTTILAAAKGAEAPQELLQRLESLGAR